jgi:hypothetical protein
MKYCRLRTLIRTSQSSRIRLSSWNGKKVDKIFRWNIFFHLYSEKMMQDFLEKNKTNFNPEMLNSLNFSDLFKAGMLNSSQGGNFINQVDLNNLLSSNPLFLSTIESFKNISRTLNINYPFNSVKLILIN